MQSRVSISASTQELAPTNDGPFGSSQLGQAIRFLRLRDVELAVGLKRACIYQRISDGTFPRPVPLGETPNSPVGWVESEIAEWQRQRLEIRDRKALKK